MRVAAVALAFAPEGEPRAASIDSGEPIGLWVPLASKLRGADSLQCVDDRDRSRPPMLLEPEYQWTVSPFDLVYDDANEDEWTLAIGTLFFNP